MRILFAGAIHGGLQAGLREIDDVEVIAPDALDWYQAMCHGESPAAFADRLYAWAKQTTPDAIVIPKGWGYRGACQWSIPVGALWAIRRDVKAKLVYASHDDPAGTPITLETGIPAPCHLWLTTCADVVNMFPVAKHTAAAVREWWLGWDQRIEIRDAFVPTVDVGFFGTPYYEPFPAPHYRGGFSVPRRDIVRACLEAGLSVGLWGPKTWLDPDQGGDPAFETFYKGWVNDDRVHEARRQCRVEIATHLVEGYRYESGRIPFCGGAGGCVLIHEERPGLREEFGDAIAWFNPGHISVAVDMAKRLVADESTRGTMAADLRRHVMARHTWAHRARRLIDLLT